MSDGQAILEVSLCLAAAYGSDTFSAFSTYVIRSGHPEPGHACPVLADTNI